MTEEDTRAAVLESLQEVAPEADLDGLDPDESFRDQIEFDSIDYLNFVLIMERKLGLKVPELDYPRLASLSGAVVYLETKIIGAGKAP